MMLQSRFAAPWGDSNLESLVRWIKQPDGSFRHDFTNFDRYLDMVAKAIGKPRTLRLNCWGENNPGGNTGVGADMEVTVHDPATGKSSRMRQPPVGTEENYRFWKPVFDVVLEKLAKRGWLDETTLGCLVHANPPPPHVLDVAHRLWPKGEWSWSSHCAGYRPGPIAGTGNITMPVRHADQVNLVAPTERPLLWTQDKPRRDTLCWLARHFAKDTMPMWLHLRILEGFTLPYRYDGMGEVFGLDLFPLKGSHGRYIVPEASRGVLWQEGSTRAILYPGPDGPVATERFEAFREGLQLAEAVVFLRHALATKDLNADLRKRAEPYMSERETGFRQLWFRQLRMPSEVDAKLLDLTGEVAREPQ